MKQYASYKPSGTPWIGDIPSHWKVKRGKFLFNIIAGFPADSHLFTPEDEGIPLIRIRDIDSTTTEVNYVGEYPEEYIILTNDVLVGMDGDFNIARWKGVKALLNQRVCKICDSYEYLINFAYYALAPQLKCINEVTYATTVKHLSTSDIGNSFLPLPSVLEQRAIADYLDKKCGSIDRIIATQERRVALLSELKQSIITEAVTRGLNPDAPLKDSGIDWIGQIPEHWRTMRLKYWLSTPLMYGANEAPDSNSETAPRYIRITDIDDNGELREETFCSLSMDKAQPYLLKPGNILFARSGATVGKTYIHRTDENACFAGYLIKADINESIAVPEYVYYYTKSSIFNCWKDSINIQATIQNIGADKYANLFITFPPINEQKRIIETIKTKIRPVDSAIAKAKREIELLREFKQSVITEAVTGKIKVC